MPLLECSYCGCADFKAFLIRDNGYICKCCGRYTYEERSLGEDDVRRLARCDSGYAEIRSYRFSEAQKIFEDIIRDYPTCVEAHWGLLQAKYGIVYVKGFYTGQVTPIYCFPDYDHENIEYFTDSSEYKNFLALLEKDTDIRKLYEKKAAEIDEALDLFADSVEDDPIDVFICVKISRSLPSHPDNTEKTELDFPKAKYLREKLTAMGKKVFFSFESLTNNPNSDMEIWSNLVRSKKMILIASSRDYIESVWVRSEWERWLSLGEENKKNLYIYLLGNAKHLSRRLPQELRGRQYYSEETEEKLLSDLFRDIEAEKKQAEEEAAQKKEAEHKDRMAEQQRQFDDFRAQMLTEIKNAKKESENSEIESLKKELSDTENSLAESRKLAYDRENEIKRLTGSLTAAEKELALAKNAAAQKDTAIASLRKENTDLREKCLSYEKTAAELDGKNKLLSEKLSQSEKRESELLRKLAEREASEKTLAAKLGSCEQRIKELTEENERLSASAGDTSLGDALKKEIEEMKLAKEASEKREKDTADRLAWLEYEKKELVAKLENVSKNSKEETPAEKTEVKNEVKTAADAGKLLYKDGHKEYFPKNLTEIPDKAYNGRDIVQAFLPEGVRRIGELAFSGCQYLLEVRLPESLESIGESAFDGCIYLKEIAIPEGVSEIPQWAFTGCRSLENVSLHGGISSVGRWGFSGCTSLKRIELPEKLVSLGEKAFSACSSLEEIKIPDSLTKISAGLFDRCTSLKRVEIPESVTEISREAFKDCSALTDISLSGAVTEIGRQAFKNCTALTVSYGGTREQWEQIYPQNDVNVIFKTSTSGFTAAVPEQDTIKDGKILYRNGRESVIPYGTKEIAENAYSGKSAVKIVLPEGVEVIKKQAFMNCEYLTEISLPDSVHTLGDWVFYGCRSLKTVRIPPNVRQLSYNLFSGCSSLAYITIPKNVERIGSWIFSGCTSLASIKVEEGNPVYYARENCLIDKNQKLLVACCKTSVIPTDRSVTTIGTGAFSMHTWLTELNLPESIRKIESMAFNGCSKLTEITLPDGLTNIGSKAFANCTSLKKLVMPESVKTIAKTAFENCSALTVYYAGSKEGWSALGMGAEIKAVCEKSMDGTATYKYGRTETIPFGKTSVALREYRKKSDLVKLILPRSVKEIKGGFLGGPFESCTSLTEIFLPEGITNIPDFSFLGCSSLIKVNIPSTASAIGVSAFNGCTSLTSVRIPEGVKEICLNAFRGCKKLTYIEIPKSVERIDASAFNEIPNLTVWYRGTREQWKKLYPANNVRVSFS